MFGPKLPAPLAAAGLAAVVLAGGVATAVPALAAPSAVSLPASAAPRTNADAGTPAGDPGAAADPSAGLPADPGAPSLDSAAVPADPTDPSDPAGDTSGLSDPLPGSSADAPSDLPSDTGAGGQAADPPSGGGVSSFGAHALDVSPARVAPGGTVTIRLVASCTAGHKAKASAAVFVDSITLAPASDGNGLEGSAFIKSDATSGSYAVSVSCDGGTSTAQASVTVTTSTTPVTPVTPVTPLKPVRPVPAGGGGTAQLAAGPAVAGSNAVPLAVTGAFAAVGLAGLALRRRRAAGPRG